MRLTALFSRSLEPSGQTRQGTRARGFPAPRGLCLLAPLLLLGGGCKRAPSVPAVPTGGAQTAASSAPAAASLAVEKKSDRQAAQAANRQGMRAYKAKDYATAKQHFGSALTQDESFALPHYNLACVAALTGDAATASSQLAWLAGSPEPQARRTLRKALYDADLKSLVGDPAVRTLLHWGGVIGGVRVLVDAHDATEEEAKRLRKSDETYDEECDNEPTYRATFALSAELASDRPGEEVVTGSLASGVAIFDARGKLMVRGGGYECVGSSAGLFGVALAQIIPDPDPEILVHYESGGRESHAQALDILKRKGDTLATIFSFTLSASERARGDDEEGSDERTAAGALSLAQDGSLIALEAGEQKPKILRFHPSKFAFLASETPAPAAPRSDGNNPSPARK